MKKLVILFCLSLFMINNSYSADVKICEELNYDKLEKLSEKKYSSESKQWIGSGILTQYTLFNADAFINHAVAHLSKYKGDYASYYEAKNNCEKCLVERERIIDFLKYKNLKKELAEIKKRNIDSVDLNKINCDE